MSDKTLKNFIEDYKDLIGSVSKENIEKMAETNFRAYVAKRKSGSKKKTLKNFIEDYKDLVGSVSKENIEKMAETNFRAYVARDNNEPKGNGPAPDGENLFESGDVNELKLIYTLNDYIGNIFKDSLYNNANQPKKVDKISVPRLMGNTCKLPKPEICDFQTMYSSGANSDCLIHSFLTATCNNFRKLPQENKNKVARSFRHYLYPQFELTKAMLKKNSRAHEKIFTPGTFLGDEDLLNIVNTYKINCIVFATANTSGYASGQQKATVYPYMDDDRGNDAYMFINRTLVHWESVCTDKGSYTISKARAENIFNTISEASFRGGNGRRHTRKNRAKKVFTRRR